ncbi:MAG: AsmA family protein [Candidatus Ratteibacteria bacterium]|nr:AsmA family protein [Candidatus Ratteibacteria bacterium]
MKLQKKILILSVFITAIIFGLSFYLEKVFLPEKIKTLAVSFLKEKLDLEASIKSVKFSFWKGIQLTDFVINNPAEFEQKRLLEVKKAVLKPALLPLLRKSLVISTIVIDEPLFSLERNPNGLWNIARFLEPSQSEFPSAAKSRSKQFSLRISKVIIQNGNIFFTDKGIEPSFSRQIKNLNLNISPLGLHLALIYRLSLLIDEDGTEVEARGKFFPLARRGGINLAIRHLGLSGFTPYLNKFATFSFDNGYLDIAAELSVNKNTLGGHTQLDLSQIVFYLKDVYDTPLVFSSGKIATRFRLDEKLEEINFQNSSISLGEMNINGQGRIKSFKTNPQLTFNFSSPLLDLKNITFAIPTTSLDFYKSLKAEGPFKIAQGEIFMPFKKMPETDYKVTAELQKAGCSFGFLASRIENMQGNLNFDRDKIETSDLKARIEKLPFSVNGSWGVKPPAKVNLNFPFPQFSLGNLQNALGKNFPGLTFPLDFQGSGKGNLNIIGKEKKLNWRGGLQIIEGIISRPNWDNKIEKVNGRIDFTDNSLSVKSLKGFWQNNPLTLTGRLKNFKQPQIEINLSGPESNLKGRTKSTDSGELLDLSGNYRGIPIKLQGKIKKLAPLIVDCKLKSFPLEVEKLATILPANFKEIFKKFKLSGANRFSANLQGNLLDWKTWKANGNFSFPHFHIFDLNLKEFSSNFNLDRQKLSLSYLKAVLYGGAMQGDFQINFAEAYPGYLGNLLLSNIDLARLTKDTDWKDKGIEGLAAAEIKFNGFDADWDRLKGKGWLHLLGSRLWEIPLLGELANILLIPGLDKSIIREGHCNFNINQGRAYTKDLKLLSDNVSLEAEGSIGFDSTLDFDITMQFSGGLKKEAKALTKLADLVLKTVEYLLIQVELKGTIADPEYDVLPFPIEKILRKELKKKVGDFFLDLLEKKK